MLQIYCAGAVLDDIGDWRKELPEIRGVRWIIPKIPFDGDRETWFLPAYFFPADLMGIRQADALLVNIIPGYKSLGTAHETGYAYALGKPIYMVVPEGPEDDDMDDGAGFDNRFGIQMATAEFRTLEDACEAIVHAVRVLEE